MIYKKEIISYRKIKSALKPKEQMDRDIIGKINGGQAECLITRGKTKKRNFDSSRSKFRSKSRHRNLDCNYCHKMGHINANCFKLKKLKQKGKPSEKNNETAEACDAANENK